MLNSKVSQAVAAALALGAAVGAQAAAPPAGVTLGQVPAGNIIYISGSTAISPALKDYLINSLDGWCDTNAATPIEYSGTESGGQFDAVTCVASANMAAHGIPAGTTIAYIKENNAGSKNGILPVSTPGAANPVSYPQVSTIDAHCSAAAPAPTSATIKPGLEGYFTYTCDKAYTIVTSTDTAGPYSALGYADVEAAIFGLTKGAAGAGSSVDTPFGIAVGLGLYHALQGAEGLTENNAIGNMPTLSRVQLAGIFNGSVTDWSHVQGSAGTVGSQSVHWGNSGISGANRVCWNGTTQSAIGGACNGGTQTASAFAPHDSTIYFCERGQSSGTQNTDQIFFAGQGCVGTPVKFSLPTQTACTASGCTWGSAFTSDRIFAGNGQGDDLSCLEGHDQQGQFAVTFSSTDQEWGPVAVGDAKQSTADWRFIRIDGYAPSNENIAAGKYDLWAQSAFYFAQSGAKNFPTGIELSLLNFYTNSATQIGGGTAAAIDDSLQRTNPQLDGGVLAIPGGSAVPHSSSDSQATFQNSPVNGFLRNNPGNNCQPPYLAPNAPNISNTPAWDPTNIQ